MGTRQRDLTAPVSTAQLREDARAAAALDLRIRSQVMGLRSRGVSWSKIGECLGVTRQAAQQRYGRDVLI